MIILGHGGAGRKAPVKKSRKKLEEALEKGLILLKKGGSAIDAVVEAVTAMEDSGAFNAGAGGNIQLDGVRRLDASVMDGGTLEAGSVIGLEGIRNPVKAARIFMDLPHKILTGTGAKRIAEAYGLEPLDPPDEKAVKRLEKLMEKESEIVKLYGDYFSTVGALALDMHGNVAAASSTGGVALMLPGRVGDTPIIGAGIYAENGLGATACTGRGEDIIRLALAKEVCMNMKGRSPEKALLISMDRVKRIGGQAGVLALGKNGGFSVMHTTDYMLSGIAGSKGIIVKDSWH